MPNAKNRTKGRNSAPKKKSRPESHTASQEKVAVLSPCATLYAKSLVDPWIDYAPCLPSAQAFESRRLRVWSSGTVARGNTGSNTGFITYSPGLAIANDIPCVYVTDGNYAGSTIDIGAAGVTGHTSNSDYASADLSAVGVQARLVSAGIRIKYTGTELERGGRFVGLEEPEHGNTLSMNIADLKSHSSYSMHTTPSGDKYLQLVISGPKNPTETDFTPTLSGNLCTNMNFFLAIIFDGGGASFPLEYEVVSNFEVIGNKVQGKVMGHHDPIGAGAVQQALTQIAAKSMSMVQSGQMNNKLARVWQGVKSILTNSITTILPKAGVYGKLALGAGQLLLA